jgi:hypothetical protein
MSPLRGLCFYMFQRELRKNKIVFRLNNQAFMTAKPRWGDIIPVNRKERKG